MADETLSERDRMLIAFHTFDLITKTRGLDGGQVQAVLVTEYANLSTGDPSTLARFAELAGFADTARPMPIGDRE